MPIEFRCSQCNQLLRVPEDAAGKNARCPKCQALMTVPGMGMPPTGELPLATEPTGQGPPQATAPFAPLPSAGNPYAGTQPTGGASLPPKPPAENPFAAPSDSLNPYASPSEAAMQPMGYALPSLPISPRPVTADAIFSYAWQIWKTNLGLLVGVTLAVAAANYAIVIPAAGIQEVLEQQGEPEAGAAVAGIAQIVASIIQMFLGIGQVQINLRLARRQPASFGDLFGGIGLFLPVLGGGIIAGLGLILGTLCLIVPAILMMLAFWPYYYLIVDRKAGVMESFTVASQITQGNWGSSFLLWLMSVGIGLLGCMAFCIGLLFAAPLISMMFAVGYLMMSGQIPSHPLYEGYAALQPAPAK